MFSSKELKKLIFPLIAECFLSISLGIVDSIMIASVGEAEMSGVSLVDMINTLIINFFTGLATGGAVIVAQFVGQKNKKRSSDCATDLLILSFLFGTVVSCVMLFVKAPLLRLMFGAIKPDVMSASVKYLTYSAVSYPVIAVYSASAALFRSIGNSSISMKSSLVMNIINIAGNAVLIYGLNWGIDGAAIATVGARTLAMLYLFTKICNKKEEVHATFKGHRIDFGIVSKILFIGIPSSLENSIFHLGRIVVVNVITVFGTAQIAANAAANSLDSFGIIAGQGFQLAMITVVGQCVGAGNDEQTIKYARLLMKMCMIANAVLNAAVVLSLPFVLPLFTSLSAEARELSATLVCIHAIAAILLWPISFVLPNALKAAGDVKYTMICSVVSMIIMRVLFSYVIGIGFGLGAIGVWIAMVMDWILRSVMFVLRFRSRKWLRESLV